ncbi:MAG: tRNA (cytidine(32)/uridine(32)-2'-O)-methyltransferase, partial [uncultured Rubellimicrobium sp.]
AGTRSPRPELRGAAGRGGLLLPRPQSRVDEAVAAQHVEPDAPDASGRAGAARDPATDGPLGAPERPL